MELRDPFPVDAIKVKPQSVNSDKTKGLVTYYIDARLVAERLNEVVGNGNWTDEYKVIVAEPALGCPVECRLTVDGVTKSDVGQVAPGELDDKVWKSAYSDAFKRAAVKFGIGAYLYDSPNVWAEVRTNANGKVQGFSDSGRAYALNCYEDWALNGKAPQVSPAADGSRGGAAGARAGTATPSASPPAPAPNGQWTMPFGKHKGQTIEQIHGDNPGYLDWLMDKSDKQDIKDRIVAFRESLVTGELVAAGATEVRDGFTDPSDIPFERSIDGLGN